MMTKYLNRSAAAGAKQSLKRSCKLEPMEAEHQTIHLNSGQNVIGRSKETGIRDVRCSKRQLDLDVDLEQGRIKLRVLGMNPCGINGLMAMKDTECELQNGDVLEVVYGKHPFEVLFKPPPENSEVEEKNEPNASTAATSECWDSVENGKMMVFTSAGVSASEKIAAYDIDGTIITTKSGNVFPKTTDDWRIIWAEVPAKLKLLHQDGYKICFFTNQGGIASGKVNLDDFKKKIAAILKKVGVPVQVFIAISDGHYRKPLPGMWDHLKEHKNDAVDIKLEKSFFVGDAAGRPEVGAGSTKRKKDHSLADRLFAANVGISFYTPEEHFLGKKKETWVEPEYEPRKIDDAVPLLEPESAKIPADSCEMIIMVGLPGSGKSHFAQEHLAMLRYTVANADTLGSTQACLKVCEKALKAGQSCVVDNTNVDVESRKKFLDLAKSLNLPCRCFVMNLGLAQVKHNLAFRNLTDTKHAKIKEMVLNMLKKKYTAPTLEEGFAAIVKVNMNPKFHSTHEENLYKLYLTEK